MTTKAVTARAPGKIILSGEHAVVYGCPALAIPIKHYSETTITTHTLPTVLFDFPDLKYKKAVTLDAVYKLKKNIDKRYDDFFSGRKLITHVIQKPEELLQYSFAHIMGDYASAPTVREAIYSSGLVISQTSTLPISCGLGSSAAMIVSQLRALNTFFDLQLDRDALFTLARHIEHRQHGHSSGIDIAVALDETACYFNEWQWHPEPTPTHDFRFIHTGKAQSSTGECVAHAAPFFKDEGLKKEFTMTTEALRDALINNDTPGMRRAIQSNHALLHHIGVVPDNVHQFIKAIEAKGGAAKICGAGATHGNSAGIMLVSTDQDITEILDEFEFGFFLDSQGN